MLVTSGGPAAPAAAAPIVVARPRDTVGRRRRECYTPSTQRRRFASREEPARAVCLAIPGRVVEVVNDANELAVVDVAGVRRTVNVSLLVDDDGHGVGPGEWVLIHVGFALSRVDEVEALATLALLEEMGARYDEELEELKRSVVE